MTTCDLSKAYRNKALITFSSQLDALAAVEADETLSVFERLGVMYHTDRAIVMAAIRHGPYHQRVSGWRGAMGNEFFHAYNFLTGPLRRDHEVILAAIKSTKNDWVPWLKIDNDMKGHTDFVKLYWRFFKFASDGLRNNKSFVENLIRNGSSEAIEFAGPVVLEDKRIWEVALENSSPGGALTLMRCLPASLRADLPLLRRLVRLYPSIFKKAGSIAHGDFQCAVTVALESRENWECIDPELSGSLQSVTAFSLFVTSNMPTLLMSPHNSVSTVPPTADWRPPPDSPSPMR